MKTVDRNKFYAPQSLGKTRSLTPEGYLLCEGVAIGRVGVLRYKPEEVGLEGGPDGTVYVERTAEEAFRPESLASLEGKPVTIYHPPVWVTPENYDQYAVGTVQNVRRGTADTADLILADLLITKPNAIRYVNQRLPQTSAGYDADYEQVAPGRGNQHNIFYNHVALLDHGRAGSRCSVKDGDPPMKSKFIEMLARLVSAVKTKDEAAVKEILDEEVDDTSDPVEALDKKVKKLTTDMDSIRLQLEALPQQIIDKQQQAAPTPKQQTTDADAVLAAMFGGESLTGIKSRAEILSPGISIPAGDALTVEAGTEFVRKALTNCVATTDGAACVNPFLMGRDLGKLAGESLLSVFTGASELKKADNNKRTSLPTAKTKDFGKAVSPTDMNAAATKFWSGAKA